jgi:pimeloyl-ACP methyl ester carboxylesterase
MTGHNFTYQNKQLYFQATGQGRTVLLLHGFGEDGTVWDLQVNNFPEYTLIIPDLPGSGRSELIDVISMESMATAMKALLDSFLPENEKVNVIGHSMGGYIALAFAELFPEKIHGLGFCHSTAYADSEDKKKVRRKGIDFIRQNGAYPFLQTSIPGLFAPQTKEENPEIIAGLVRKGHNFSASALVSYYEAMIERPDHTEVLKKSKLPVLFIGGIYDNAVPVNDVLRLCILPELSYIHILPCSGHMGMLEQPFETNAYMRQYLNILYP